MISLTCGSRLSSERQAGGPGGDGHSNETYEPDKSHSVRNDDDLGGYNWNLNQKNRNLINYSHFLG